MIINQNNEIEEPNGAYNTENREWKCNQSGIDNLNDYYDPVFKDYRLALIDEQLRKSKAEFIFAKGDISDRILIEKIFADHKPRIVINLAAQAGVRYSIINPNAYINSNILGFYNILECCRHSYDSGFRESEENSGKYRGVEHLVYASSSSVYGSNQKVPFEETVVDRPVSLYAATKKSNELLAYSHAKLYDISRTGLGFFTVYGHVGRPDMFYFSATQKLLKGEKIKIFNYGNCKRDFTYIEDIVGVRQVMAGVPKRSTGKDELPVPPYSIYNIGNSNPEDLLDFVQILQEELVRAKILPENFDSDAYKEFVPMQSGGVPVTYADTSALEKDYGYKTDIDLRTGLRKFAEWYVEFYK